MSNKCQVLCMHDNRLMIAYVITRYMCALFLEACINVYISCRLSHVVIIHVKLLQGGLFCHMSL